MLDHELALRRHSCACWMKAGLAPLAEQYARDGVLRRAH